MICENCGCEHNGSYGSGRFCSQKCASSFSTKAKRREINAKVSKTLKNSGKESVKIICKNCNTEFEVPYCRRNRKFCSGKCSSLFNGRLGGLALKKDTSKMGGLRPNGGKCINYEYTNNRGFIMKLNKDEIKVANILDNLKLNWNRNWKWFKYNDINGKPKKFYPDFYLIDFDVYVEYKGWVNYKINHKMNDAIRQNKDLNLIIIYSEDKRYSKLGLNLKELINNNAIIFKYIH